MARTKIDRSNELPRKEAVRAIVSIIYGFRKLMPRDFSGHHRLVATCLVDDCKRFTKEDVYKTRFIVGPTTITALKKHVPVATFDLVAFKKLCTQTRPDDWDRVLSKFQWIKL